MTIAATGHRPPKLGSYDMKTRRALGGLAAEWLHYNQPDQIISGMALGWDQAVAGAAVLMGIPFIAAVPFPGQDSLWPEESRDRYARLLGHAQHVEYVCPTYSVAAMQKLNEWMVDRADKMLALWDGSFGGTHNCIVYARKKGVVIENLWTRWSLPDDLLELLG